MVRRLISANTSEILAMNAEELKQSIQASEGRTILSENVVIHEPLGGDITNAEIAKAFGADLILLNAFDTLHPAILGLYAGESSIETAKNHSNIITYLKKMVGRPIGVNLEPVDPDVKMLENKLTISEGRKVSEQTIKAVEDLGFDFICLTGNPGTGVTNEQIGKSILLVKKFFSGLIIAGKMHGAGVDEPIVDLKAVQLFIDSGADILLVPAVGTVPEVDDEELKKVVKLAHKQKKLVMSAIGTSQESADEDTIKQIAIRNKIIGVDIQHIGDAGYSGLAPVENIMAISTAIRGKRHTISRMARSINR